MSDTTVIVLAKEPRPGLAKTRLTPPCTPEQAAELATAALEDTLQAVSETPAARRILAVEGEWRRPAPDFEVMGQADGGLDARIGVALEAANGPAVLVGMDTPQLTPGLLSACDFERHPAWLGPATDGGFWLIGLAQPDARLIHQVPMSTSYTCERQHTRLRDGGLGVGILPELTDVDTWDAAIDVAAAAPHTRFGRTVGRLACS